MGEIVRLSVADDAVGRIGGRSGDRHAAQFFGETVALGDVIAIGFAKVLRAWRFDMKHGPGRVQTIGKTTRIAYERGRTPVFADAGEHAIAGLPWPRNR